MYDKRFLALARSVSNSNGVNSNPLRALDFDDVDYVSNSNGVNSNPAG